MRGRGYTVITRWKFLGAWHSIWNGESQVKNCRTRSQPEWQFQRALKTYNIRVFVFWFFGFFFLIWFFSGICSSSRLQESSYLMGSGPTEKMCFLFRRMDGRISLEAAVYSIYRRHADFYQKIKVQQFLTCSSLIYLFIYFLRCFPYRVTSTFYTVKRINTRVWQLWRACICDKRKGLSSLKRVKTCRI